MKLNKKAAGQGYIPIFSEIVEPDQRFLFSPFVHFFTKKPPARSGFFVELALANVFRTYEWLKPFEPLDLSTAYLNRILSTIKIRSDIMSI